MTPEKPLHDQVAIVTGASRGIGKAISLQLAAHGCHIAGVSRSESSAASIKEEVEAFGVTYRPYAVDVSSGESVQEAAKQILQDFEKIDILVNNAGITKDTLLMRMSDEDWQAVLQTNLSGAFYWTKAVTRPMSKARSGRIVNISSVIGQHGNAGQVNYAAAKAGMIGMTKSVAKELAGRNITCNCVCPGFIETDMTDELSEELKATLLEQIPLKRMGSGADIAHLVTYLAGPHSSYLTGQEITIDGGLFI
ncbi:MAG: 3-oxoacyl-ACP reductase FabG [Verrucomicrobiota bacterium]